MASSLLLPGKARSPNARIWSLGCRPAWAAALPGSSKPPGLLLELGALFKGYAGPGRGGPIACRLPALGQLRRARPCEAGGEWIEGAAEGVDIRGGGDVPGVSAGPPGLDGVSPAWTMARRVSHEGGRRAPRRPADGTARPDPSPNPAGAGTAPRLRQRERYGMEPPGDAFSDGSCPEPTLPPPRPPRPGRAEPLA